MTDLTMIVTALLLISGSLFVLTAAVGLIRLPDIYTRMHAASKAGSVGSGLMLIAVGIHAADASTLTRAIVGVIFFLLTAPISAHLLAKAAYVVGYRLSKSSIINEMNISKKS